MVSVRTVASEDAYLVVYFEDGRVLGVPLAWFPRLSEATAAQLAACEISPFGLHWPAFDEDVSVAGLLAGRGNQFTLSEVRARDARAAAPTAGRGTGTPADQSPGPESGPESGPEGGAAAPGDSAGRHGPDGRADAGG